MKKYAKLMQDLRGSSISQILIKIKAFSLVELLVSLIIISLLLAALAPVITKKAKSTNVSLIQSGEITTECQSSSNYGDKCELCTKKYCIKCGLKDCTVGTYAENKTCKCVSCANDEFGNNCLECNSNGCTRCPAGFYIESGKCTPCPSGFCCDGVKKMDDNEPGYYCEGNIAKECTLKYGSVCLDCNSSGCLACGTYNSVIGGICQRCSTNCVSCNSYGQCLKCAPDWMLNNGSCDVRCNNSTRGNPLCHQCTSKMVNGTVAIDKCEVCYSGYYITSIGGCNECNIENCSVCVNNKNSAVCETCFAGFYLSNNVCKACSSKFPNCAACSKNECLSCELGYYIKDGVCQKSDNNFNCADSNFMRIGKLCVTRKNMGDSQLLKIPPSINIVENTELCATNSKCCWNGTTSGSCNNKVGSDTIPYSGCNRTSCNWAAASEICANFNYGGKTWRLPKPSEMSNWTINSNGLGINGLQLCDYNNATGIPRCYVGSCSGTLNGCRNYIVWADDSGETSTKAGALLLENSAGTISAQYKTLAASVRCVTEMD